MTIPLLPLLDVAGRVLDRVLPDVAERDKVLAELQAELSRQVAEVNKAQAEVNKTEAANSRLFVSGWRPFIGWICAVSLGWHYIGMPLGLWLAAIYDPALTLPALGDDGLMELVFGMLGIGGLRTYEKKIGVTR